jgi:hypothetical protein
MIPVLVEFWTGDQYDELVDFVKGLYGTLTTDTDICQIALNAPVIRDQDHALMKAGV